MCCRYGQMMLASGVKSDDLVAVCLTNTPQFMFCLFGSWAIGTAPAMINYNLAGDALIHCLKVSKAKVVIVDEDPDVRKKIEDVRERIEGELGMRIVVLDEAKRQEVESSEPKRPEDKYREKVTPADSIFLLYTR